MRGISGPAKANHGSHPVAANDAHGHHPARPMKPPLHIAAGDRAEVAEVLGRRGAIRAASGGAVLRKPKRLRGKAGRVPGIAAAPRGFAR
jgi:hypothetical protein